MGAIQQMLLGTSGASLDSDVAAYYANLVTYASGASLNSTEMTAIEAFVAGCKADSIWSLILDMSPLFGSDWTAAHVKLKSLSATPTLNPSGFVSTDYTRATGYTGKTGAVLYSRVFGTDLTSGSSGIFVYDRGTFDVTNNGHGCASGGTNYFILNNAWADNNMYSYQYNTANAINTIGGGPVKLVHAIRSAGPLHRIYRNGANSVSTSTVGGSLPTTEIAFMGTWNGTSTGQYNITHPIGCLGLTAGMDSTQAAAFNTRIVALMTAVGRNV